MPNPDSTHIGTRPLDHLKAGHNNYNDKYSEHLTEQIPGNRFSNIWMHFSSIFLAFDTSQLRAQLLQQNAVTCHIPNKYIVCLSFKSNQKDKWMP